MPIYKDGKTKNADGLQRYKVRINYQDINGNNKQLTRVAYGLQQAKQLECQLQNERKEPSTALTVKGLYDLYYENKKHEIRETTLDKIEIAFRVHIIPELGAVKATKLNVPVLQSWKNSINNKDLGMRTKKNLYGMLRSFLNWCVKSEYITASPLSKIDNFRDAYETHTTEKLKYYTPEQFKAFIAVAKEQAEAKQDWRFYTFFMLAFYTGMRKGEINALKWSDIEGNKIHVRRSIAQKIKGEDRETPPKNKSSYRTLQAPATLVMALDKQRERHSLLSPQVADMRVCGGDMCLRDTSIDHRNRLCADKANLPHISIHDFRHSHASLLANNGINIQEIARRLGHSKIEQTWNTYSHLYPQEEERAIAVLDAI